MKAPLPDAVIAPLQLKRQSLLLSETPTPGEWLAQLELELEVQAKSRSGSSEERVQEVR